MTTCEKCEKIHEAQKNGLINLPCLCGCHKDHVCPIYPYYPTNPIWVVPTTVPYYGYTWCGTNTNDSKTFSITAANACAAPTTFSVNNHCNCGSGCKHT